MTDVLIIEKTDKVTTITINREARRNALDHVASAALEAALNTCRNDGTTVIVLRGAGMKSFCAGDDVKAYAERTPEQNWVHYQTGLRIVDAIEDHPCLIIAAIEGYCLGGGLELAIACDYRIVGESASFGLPEVRKLDVIPSWGGLTRLSKILGLALAKEVALFGERWSADEARARGLVSRVVADGEAFDEAVTLATEYAESVSGDTISLAKQALVHAQNAPREISRLINSLTERSGGFANGE
jgi:enoyl-CoA hydratase/carnithine racemase